MLRKCLTALRDHVPLFRRLERLPRQLLGFSPFAGDVKPRRVRIFQLPSGRPTLPFPHPWNYQEPIRILETFFHRADAEEGSPRHTRYLEAPWFAPVLVTRDPGLIRAIATETGDKPGQFDRDTLPSVGIARATGKDTLLYANGATWKHQKRLSTPPFGRTTLFQPDQFHEFEETFRHTVAARLEAIHEHLRTNKPPVQVQLEPEIKAVMLEMLVNNFFGAAVPYEEIRNRFVPALERVIDHIVRDTVINKLGLPLHWLPSVSRRIAQAKIAQADFETLTDIALSTRKEGKGLWRQFKSEAPDEILRSNIKVFLAGALEATTSYASWAIAHLARNLEAQEKLYQEVKDVEAYTPEGLEKATYLKNVLDETLRLTPSLYFFPRRATADTWIETTAGQKLWVPKGTHILLDVWHANRHEDHWGVAVTGYPAIDFVPERWDNVTAQDRGSKDLLHFGFGHGPRFCPGKHLGQLEVALVVGAIVKLFRFKAVHAENAARAGVSTKPADGVLVELELREAIGEREAASG
ncbi:MAG: cytochrome P450 [Phycisphaeraceae bacterium]